MKLYNGSSDNTNVTWYSYKISKDENNIWQFNDFIGRIELALGFEDCVIRPNIQAINSSYKHLLNEDMNNLNIEAYIFYSWYSWYRLKKDSYFFTYTKESYNKIMLLQRQQKIEKIKEILDNEKYKNT